MTVPRALPAPPSEPGLPFSAVELLRQVATAADERQTRGGSG